MSAHGDVDLGHTVAGWTGTALAVLGSALAGLAVCRAWAPGVWLGLGLVGVAALVTWLLHLAGWGKPGGPRPAAERDWRRRDAAARTGHGECLGCRLGGPRRAAAAAPRSPSAALPAAGDGGA
ncbi:HGxxPAAW family protein [Streptomyces sp. NPDC006326]|uniref:HGxxPAAW family protein n=1 Tax=Streptomyces sp. NPDC006326 TaxID=3156752 RepID=UPI0033A03203